MVTLLNIDKDGWPKLYTFPSRGMAESYFSALVPGGDVMSVLDDVPVFYEEGGGNWRYLSSLHTVRVP